MSVQIKILDNGWGYEKLPKAICAEGVQPLEPHIRMLSDVALSRVAILIFV